MEQKKRQTPACTGALMRRTMRRLSQHYDEALRPLNLKLTQYSVLANLAAYPDSSITDLADVLEMDRTTLTRNLGPLQRRGLVQIRTGSSPRNRAVALTPQGVDLLRTAKPVWRAAEEGIRAQLGGDDVAHLHDLLQRVLEDAKALDRPETVSTVRGKGDVL